MATVSHAFKPSVDAIPHFSSQQFKPFSLYIDLAQVSVSQLLGRDYIFLDQLFAKLPIEDTESAKLAIENLVSELDLTEAYSVVVSVDETNGVRSFTRHDLIWNKHKIIRLESCSITNEEQHDFMEMIWQCSSSVLFV